MEIAEMILQEVREIKRKQDATFADLTERLDIIDRQTDIPLTPGQAAVFLGVSSSTITNYRAKGLLQKKTRNGLVGYLRQDLEKLKRK